MIRLEHTAAVESEDMDFCVFDLTEVLHNLQARSLV